MRPVGLGAFAAASAALAAPPCAAALAAAFAALFAAFLAAFASCDSSGVSQAARLPAGFLEKEISTPKTYSRSPEKNDNLKRPQIKAERSKTAPNQGTKTALS